jgi:hypothetical protein
MSDLALIVSLSNIGLRMISEKKLAQELQAMMQRLANQELLLQSVVSNTMDSLGNQEVRNAQEALKDALISSSPRHELTSAINHLQSAASHFEEKATREGHSSFVLIRGEYKTRTEYIDKAVDALHKASNCYAIIASIYSGLGEWQLTAKYADLFKLDFFFSAYVKGFHSGQDVLDIEKEGKPLTTLLTKLAPGKNEWKTVDDSLAYMRILSIPHGSHEDIPESNDALIKSIRKGSIKVEDLPNLFNANLNSHLKSKCLGFLPPDILRYAPPDFSL